MCSEVYVKLIYCVYILTIDLCSATVKTVCYILF